RTLRMAPAPTPPPGLRERGERTRTPARAAGPLSPQHSVLLHPAHLACNLRRHPRLGRVELQHRRPDPHLQPVLDARLLDLPPLRGPPVPNVPAILIGLDRAVMPADPGAGDPHIATPPPSDDPPPAHRLRPSEIESLQWLPIARTDHQFVHAAPLPDLDARRS